MSQFSCVDFKSSFKLAQCTYDQNLYHSVLKIRIIKKTERCVFLGIISAKNLKLFDFIMITQRWSFFDLLLALIFRHKIFKATVHVFLSLISFFWKKENEFYTVTFIFKKQNYTNIAKPFTSLFPQKIIALTFLVQIQRATAQVMSQKDRFKVLISKSQKK